MSDSAWRLDKISFEPWGDRHRAHLDDNTMIVRHPGEKYAIKSPKRWWLELGPLAAQSVLYHLRGSTSIRPPASNAICPICRHQAEEVEAGTVDGYWIKCPTPHGTFGVSDTAMVARIGERPQAWEAAFKRAKSRTAPQSRPKIEDDDF